MDGLTDQAAFVNILPILLRGNRNKLKLIFSLNLEIFALAGSTDHRIAGTTLSRWNLHPLQNRTPWLTITNFYPDRDSRGCGFISARQE